MANFDILGQTLLKDLKKNFKQFEYAVIAGGMVRDHELGADWKDIDIFVPYRGNNLQLSNLLNKIQEDGKAFGLTLNEPEGEKERKKDYKFFTTDWLYHNAISVQIMFINDVGDVNFPNRLLETFHYGVDRAYYDGNGIHFSEEFKKDKRSHQASLLKLDHIWDLPEAMKKFYRIKEKYPKMMFNCSLIEMKKKDNKASSSEGIYTYDLGRLRAQDLIAREAPPVQNFAQWVDEAPAIPEWDNPAADPARRR